jgi:ADP-ribose pyrophosphatase
MAQDRLARNDRPLPWMDVIARHGEFAPGAEQQVYQAVRCVEYVTLVALTPDGRVLLVRQYRPAVESFTLELPAGLLDGDDDPAATAPRERLEDTGGRAETVLSLGISVADSGRISNRVHSYFIRTAERISVSSRSLVSPSSLPHRPSS